MQARRRELNQQGTPLPAALCHLDNAVGENR
jgi:hypothetical protein